MPHEIQNIQGSYTQDDFWGQWSSPTPRMALLIQITTRPEYGPDIVAFTSNSRDMTLPGRPGVVFKATPAITPTTIESGLDEASNLEMTGIYNSDSFDQIEVLAGKWDFATVEVLSACWDNTDLGEFVHFKGNLGEFKDYQTFFTAEGRGAIARLSNNVNKVTSRLCRCREFGDEECGRDLGEPVTINGDTFDLVYPDVPCVLAAGEGEIDFSSGDLPANCDTSGLFANGKLECTSGQNEGIAREISTINTVFPGYRVSLRRRFPLPIEGNDTFTFTAGCDRTIERCVLYDNVINRRAEDYVPGIEAANRVPSAN